MIIFKDVSVEFNGRVLLDKINLSINYGDKIGLVGRNGSGKSTIFKLLTGEIKPTEGRIEIPDYYKIGHLSQHIKFDHKSLFEEVCSALPEERDYESYKAEIILHGLGFITNDFGKNPNEFSGGWQIKIMLSKLLLQEPNMLLLDEPTNYLDIHSIIWLKLYLQEYQGEIILITHDRSFMNSVISSTWMIWREKIRKINGKPEKLKAQIEIEEDIYEKTRLREEEERKKTLDLVQRFGSKASKASAMQSKLKMLEKKEQKPKLAKVQTLDFNFNYLETLGGSDFINVNDINFGFDKKNLLIKNLSFSISPNDTICIIGKNGNGKSTLLQLLNEILTPISGEIKVSSKAKIGYFSQMNSEQLDPKKTIVEELLSVDPKIEIGTIKKIAATVGLFKGDEMNKKIGVLSGGEKSRVMICKIVLKKINVLMLDEPTNHFDLESCESLIEAIKEFQGAKIIVTHNESMLYELKITKLIIFDKGKTILFDGNYADFIKKIGWNDDNK